MLIRVFLAIRPPSTNWLCVCSTISWLRHMLPSTSSSSRCYLFSSSQWPINSFHPVLPTQIRNMDGWWLSIKYFRGSSVNRGLVVGVIPHFCQSQPFWPLRGLLTNHTPQITFQTPVHNLRLGDKSWGLHLLAPTGMGNRKRSHLWMTHTKHYGPVYMSQGELFSMLLALVFLLHFTSDIPIIGM